jgi:hypothetical protein
MMWELTLGGRLLDFKCEWLSFTSAMNGKNGGAGVDPSLVNIGCGNSHLEGDCWVSSVSG